MRDVMSCPSKYLFAGRFTPASAVSVGSISRLDVKASDTVPAWNKYRYHKKKKKKKKNLLPVSPVEYIFS
jgi:hypothetical protein